MNTIRICTLQKSSKVLRQRMFIPRHNPKICYTLIPFICLNIFEPSPYSTLPLGIPHLWTYPIWHSSKYESRLYIYIHIWIYIYICIWSRVSCSRPPPIGYGGLPPQAGIHRHTHLHTVCICTYTYSRHIHIHIHIHKHIHIHIHITYYILHIHIYIHTYYLHIIHTYIYI